MSSDEANPETNKRHRNGQNKQGLASVPSEEKGLDRGAAKGKPKLSAKRQTADSKSGDKRLSEKQDAVKTSDLYSTKVLILLSTLRNRNGVYHICIILVWALSLTSRLYNIENPPKVCWDETHFGKFANHYLNGTFFFDVHPPLGKMLLALAGWISGYGGGFAFDKPGDPYGEEKYVGMRIFCALLGGFCIPLAFLIVYELTKSLPAALLASAFIIFDTGCLTLSQYILLDPILMFFMMMSMFSLVKFQSCQNDPFSVSWWGWMSSTGFFLACTFSVKWVGLFVILLAGLVTLKQLWDLLGDLSIPMNVIALHFGARVIGLIIIPILTYLLFFAIHFQALPLSGPGDGFFSSKFQSTLQGNSLYKATFPKDLAYGSIVTIKNSKPGGALLHSHQHLYPKEHPPEQQQITGYSHKDPNNDWLIKKPTNDLFDPTAPVEYVKDGDIVRIEHIATRRNLHSHNEKAPLTKNLLQVSGYGEEGRGDENDNWRFVIVSSPGADQIIQTVLTKFKLIHVNTGCALGETDKTLPKWGWEQREMACYQLPTSEGTVWNIESHVNDRVAKTSMEFMAPSFLESVYESHIVMAQTNSGFKPKEGEVTSRPWQWPINYRGQVFSGGDFRIYLLGNPIIWWGILAFFFVFILVYLYHSVREQRGYVCNPEAKRIFTDYLCDCISSFFDNDVIKRRIHFALLAMLFTSCIVSFYAFRGLSYGMSGPLAKDQNATQAAYKWMESWEI
eukprot:gene20305-22297_t